MIHLKQKGKYKSDLKTNVKLLASKNLEPDPVSNALSPNDLWRFKKYD